MKKLPVQMETVSGDGTVKTETAQFQILPPPPGCCAVCGVKHDPREPHNAQSLYYQYAFYGEHSRWPTWADAIAHCTPAMQAAWTAELKRMKHWSAPEGTAPIAQPYAVQQ